MKKIYIICIFTICVTLFSGCSSEKKDVDKKNDKGTVTNTIYRMYENTIEITQDQAAIQLEYLPEEYKEEYTTILLTNCNNGNITQKKYEDDLSFDNLSSGTYVIQAQLNNKDEYVDLSSYIAIYYDNSHSNNGIKGL